MEPVLLHGHAAHVLDGDQAEWLVEAGKANIFCVRVENGQPVGARRFVLTGQPGDVLLGSTAPGSANGYRFLSVGSEDCRLRRLSAAELTQPLEDMAARVVDQVARWVEKLTNLLAADMPGESPVNTGATDQAVLSPGQIFRSSQRTVCWLKVEEGSLAFMGMADLVVGPEAPLFPAGSEAWFRAETQTRVVLRKPAGFAEPADLTRGLAHFHGLIFAFLRHKEAREIKEDLTRLRERRHLEDRETDRAIRQIVSIVTPLEEAPVVRSDLLQALAVIGRQLKVAFAPPAKSEDLSRVPDPLEAIARASRVRLRHIQLRGKWWHMDCGPLLCYIVEDKDEFPVALVRSKWGAYEIFDPRDGIRKPVDASVLSKLSARAVMFYQAFPARPLTLIDLPLFAFQLFRRELALILVFSLSMTILGMLLPQAMRWIMDYALPDADRSLLLDLGLILIAVTCGKAVFLLAQGFVTLRLMTGTTATLQAATWDRLLRLAPQFFRKFASGDLLNRSMMITEVSHAIGSSTMRTLVTGCLALFNLLLLFYYSATMAVVAILVALAAAAVTTLLSVAIRKRALIMEQLDGRLFGFMVQVINGIAKLRVAGAERRAYSHWAKRFAERLRLVATVRRLEDVGSIVNVVVSPLATMAIFTLAAGMLAQTTLTMGYFLAFFTAFGIFAGGVTTVSHTLVDIMDSLAKQKLMQPILEAQPEFDAGRADPGRLSGNVFLDKIVFRYQPHSPLILNGVSVTAHTGEFIALVGPSGSGKSTLLRLLLAFEVPESGGVYYDGKNLNGLDLTAVRRQFGIVLQSARISAGSIFDNIACGNVIRLEECWQAIRDAGMEEDVAKMPMGIHTVVSEGGGNLSGGQRQRLLIARALVLNPKILMFDEATSALDNATQAIVTQSLKRRQVTRIVVAHRLSTIQDADRIYVLEKGQVRQAGRFDELSKQEGLFQRMMARQMA